jgi:hypothetical protein
MGGPRGFAGTVNIRNLSARVMDFGPVISDSEPVGYATHRTVGLLEGIGANNMTQASV